jgi:hypothetical protein
VQINHTFSFHPATSTVRGRCPGGQLAAALRHASRADVSTAGSVDILTFTNAQGHTVATLRGQHR